MAKRIRKAVFPVAGMGSRFLPATKASPKEMLPVVDKPLIQFAVEEAIEAGLTDMIFVTGRTKRAIEDHFDKAYELETELAAKNKNDLLEVVQSVLPKGITCVYIRQAEPLGLGHAVGCARDVVDDEPFAVILADDLIDGKPGALKQMVDCAHRHNGSELGVEDVPRERLGTGPREGPVRRLHLVVDEEGLGRRPHRGELRGEVERELRDERGWRPDRVGRDEGAPLGGGRSHRAS